MMAMINSVSNRPEGFAASNGSLGLDVRLKGRVGLAVVAAFMVTACTTTPQKPAATRDRIQQELQRAAAERNQGEANERAQMPPLQAELPKATAGAETRFDLSVVGAPASQVFMALVTGTRYSMLLPHDMSGAITINLKDVTVKEALDTIRELYGYEYRIQGNRIFIQPNTLQARVFQINYLAGRRQGNSDLRVLSASTQSSQSGGSSSSSSSTTSSTPPAGGSSSGGASGGRSTDTSRVSTSSDADFWRDLTTSLNAIVGTTEGRSVVVNPMTGVLVIRAFPADLRNVETYLKATQFVVERQVMLEAKIVEVTLSNDAQSGINWSIFNSVSNGRSAIGVLAPGSSLNAGTSTLLGTAQTAAGVTLTPGKFGSATATDIGKGFIGLAFQTANFSALLNFLETQGDVSVLSSPRIATLNNQKAVLKVGSDEMFVTNVSGGTASTTAVAGTAPSVTLQSYFSGISLDVTPQIDDEGNVILHVHPAISTVTEKEKIVDLGSSMGTFKLPLAYSVVNETDSIVRVQDGNIVAIGGLMRQSQSRTNSQLPGAGDDSLSSKLLGQRSSTYSKSEMVILIKPTIINSDKVWQDDLDATRGRIAALDADAPAVAPAAAAK